MFVRARSRSHQGIITATVILFIGCSSHKDPSETKKIDVKFSVVETTLDPPMGNKQKLCITVKGDPRCEFGMSTIAQNGIAKSKSFKPLGNPKGTDMVKMPKSGKTTACYDLTEQPAGKLTYELGAFVEVKNPRLPNGMPLAQGSKNVKVTISRPPFIKFQDVQMHFTGFPDLTWSMGYNHRGFISLTLPPMTKVTVDGATSQTDKRDVRVDLPLDKKAKALPLSDILRAGKAAKTVKIQVGLVFPDGQSHKGDLKFTVNHHLKKWLDQKLDGVVKGPVTFGDEPPAPSSPSYYYSGKVYGGAKKVTDITHVIMRNDKHRKRSCGMYYKPGTAKTGSSVVETEDWTFKIYDRRKGRRIKTRVFRGKMPRCPKTMKGSYHSSESLPDRNQVRKWLEGLAG